MPLAGTKCVVVQENKCVHAAEKGCPAGSRVQACEK